MLVRPHSATVFRSLSPTKPQPRDLVPYLVGSMGPDLSLVALILVHAVRSITARDSPGAIGRAVLSVAGSRNPSGPGGEEKVV